ncbi:TetR family transcriptional regulator [Agrobacterium sp. NPDC089420]|uniref:TetR/AcrR family transcriptional regulator n=1 Tax=Agrobacterium sp. NPDC089420 TaxID=3363918 RepID=UPI00384BD2DE
MARKKVTRGEGETRKRILDVAIRHFSKASYDEVALRSIAADVDVDVSYVHHSFGSKERLFLEALSAAGADPDFANVNRAELTRFLAKRSVQRKRSRTSDDVDPLLLLVRSLTSQKTSQAIAERLEHTRIEPLREKLEDAEPFRAGLVISLLIGFSVLQNLLQLPAVTEIDPDEAEALIADALEGILHSTKR